MRGGEGRGKVTKNRWKSGEKARGRKTRRGGTISCTSTMFSCFRQSIMLISRTFEEGGRGARQV